MFTYIHPSVIRKAVQRGIPFKVRLHYAQGTSNKWWELTFDPTRSTRVVYCNHGRQGSSGRSTPFEYDVGKAIDKAYEKLDKGYRPTGSTVRNLPDAPAPKAAPKPKAVKLPPPFENVTRVHRVFDKGRFVWRAEDAEGNLVSKLSDAGAQKLKALLEAA